MGGGRESRSSRRGGRDLTRLLWMSVGGLLVFLTAAVVGLDRYQASRGEVPLWQFLWSSKSWKVAREAAPPPPPREPAPSAGVPPASASFPAKGSMPAPGIFPGPRIAIIIDDLGGRSDVFEALRSMQRPFTLAVLPGLPLSEKIGREGPKAGMEVLLHLPMEPYRYPEVDPGPGSLLMGMEREEVLALVRKDLDSVPNIVGVNNHMGSRMTEDRERMRWALGEVGARGLFFVDSLTTNQSVAYDVAKEAGIRAARRQIFLDHELGEAFVRRQFDQVAEIAQRRGEAIAIGHGHILTLKILAEMVTKWEARGFRLVPVSQLVR